MSISKQFLKSKPVCKTTFRLAIEEAKEAENVVIVGDFNDWNQENPVEMKKLKDGSFKAVIDLETGKDYQFRYLIDNETWTNDEEADAYVSSPFGTENSVVSCMN